MPTAEEELSNVRDANRRLIRRILDEARYPKAWVAVHLLALKPWFLHFFKRDRVVINMPYRTGMPIAVVAVWQARELRPDVRNLLSELRSLGVYPVVVNTRRLSKESISTLDAYVERFNFGRDFGSYKAGLRLVRRFPGFQEVPRLLLLNDSVFYSTRHLQEFLTALVHSEIDVLGATENFEIQHHLGSFCISMSGSVVTSRRFWWYWRRYWNSDMRRKVIKKGEMGLSKVLARIAGSEDHFRPLFGLAQISEFLLANERNLEFAVARTNKGRTHWRKLTPRLVVDVFIQRHLFQEKATDQVEKPPGQIFNVAPKQFVAQSLSSATADVIEQYNVSNQDLVADEIRQVAVGSLLLTAASGSQIHQNSTTLLKMGCPIVKLDLIYRGTGSYEDVENLIELIPAEESSAFRKLVYARAYGGDTLIGWRRAAFHHGLI